MTSYVVILLKQQ